jgi:hypothetical protein
MKTLIIISFAILILSDSNRLLAQKTQPKLNQYELYKQFAGKWQANIGNDSIEVRECREYGLAFVIEVYRVIKGQKIPFCINNVSYDPNEGNFKGFLLYPNGGHFTWIGKFTNSNSFLGDVVFNFNKEAAWSNFHAEFISPTEFTCTNFIQEGAQTTEMKFVKMN